MSCSVVILPSPPSACCWDPMGDPKDDLSTICGEEQTRSRGDKGVCLPLQSISHLQSHLCNLRSSQQRHLNMSWGALMGNQTPQRLQLPLTPTST